MHTIALFGGTFDPIHNGHLHISSTIQKQFNFDSYRFTPCKIPTLKRSTEANTEQRIKMLELALNGYKEFTLDLREIYRKTPSYMVETLSSVRKDFSKASISLIIGYDAFLSLPKWYQWTRILQLANILVVNRESFNNQLPCKQLNDLITAHQVLDKTDFLNKPAGAIHLFNAGAYPISSTEIRDSLKKQQTIDRQLPQEVYEYIKQQGLYQ